MHLQCSVVIQLLYVICVCGVFTWEFGNVCSIKVVAHENLIQGLKIAWKLYLHVHNAWKSLKLLFVIDWKCYKDLYRYNTFKSKLNFRKNGFTYSCRLLKVLKFPFLLHVIGYCQQQVSKIIFGKSYNTNGEDNFWFLYLWYRKGVIHWLCLYVAPNYFHRDKVIQVSVRR